MFGDGSVRFGLPDLARALRQLPRTLSAIALGPQVPVLQATLSGLRRQGVPLGPPLQRALHGTLSALLLLPPPGAGGATAASTATGVGLIGVPGGTVGFPSALLLPAVQKVREAAARIPVRCELCLVLVQDTAASGVPHDQMALNFEHIRL